MLQIGLVSDSACVAGTVMVDAWNMAHALCIVYDMPVTESLRADAERSQVMCVAHSWSSRCGVRASNARVDLCAMNN